jgi:hypothetical protein
MIGGIRQTFEFHGYKGKIQGAHWLILEFRCPRRDTLASEPKF